MCEVFSRYGLPQSILTDQGSVFMSKVVKDLCRTWEIDHIRTSPYHPESDGALERWNACLKGMLKKQPVEGNRWDKVLRFCLFAYRDSPHCVTGFSPFDLMFGRDVKGPLPLLRTTWVEGEVDGLKVNDWVKSIRERMKAMAAIVLDRKAKSTMKIFYDKKAKEVHFSEADQVLVHKPGLHSKMDGSWDGPFTVGKRLSDTNYSVVVPGRKRPRVLHVNMLKPYLTAYASVHRVAVVQEEGHDCVIGPSSLVLTDDGKSLSVQECKQLKRVLDKHARTLSTEPGCTEAIKMTICLSDNRPFSLKPYTTPPRWKVALREEIDKLLLTGIIVETTSPWSSPIVTVVKKDGSLRMCIDYRNLNFKTVPDPYLMPKVEELLEQLANAVYISKIDLNKGYYQIPIAQEGQLKTAFCSSWGKFMFTQMPFGLRNAPSVFQRLIDKILHKCKAFVVVYIDDIGVHSHSWKDHCHHLDLVLTALRDAGLTANISKCEWGKRYCEFLGHVVGQGKVLPAQCKVSAINSFVQPRRKKDIRRFLGLSGYYRRFILDFASRTHLLTDATRKTAPDKVAWTPEMLSEFHDIRSALCSIPSLTLPTPTDSFVLQTDSSQFGIGAVLNVICTDEELPVAFYSRKLYTTQGKVLCSDGVGGFGTCRRHRPLQCVSNWPAIHC